MKCIVVTPEKTEVDQEATFVVVPLYDGEYGVDKGHTPTVGRVGAGELRIKTPEGEKLSFYIEGGFMEILNDTVSILTNRVIPQGELSAQDAEAALASALEKPQSNEELRQAKEMAVKAARQQIRLANKWGGK